MKKRFTLVLCLVIATILTSSTKLQAQSWPWWWHLIHHHHHHHFITKADLELNQDMRKLWEDHIIWTRNVICNILDGLPGTNEAVARLLQNQVDIGDAIKPYYGNAAGNQLTNLLTSHILIAADLLTALDINDTAALSQASTAWYQNADSIAMFLSNANPFWHYNDMKDMMFEHLDLTAAEAIARANADYTADVAAFDSVHVAMLEMADMLTMGIIHQFPGQFNREAPGNNMEIQLNDGSVMLNQNAPNPFDEQTIITFFIPDHVNNARMLFYNMTGSLIKSVNIPSKGEGTITVTAPGLSRGIYTYSIEADGKVIDTKKMIH